MKKEPRMSDYADVCPSVGCREQPQTLRKILERDTEWKGRFEQALSLSNSLFGLEGPPDRVLIPYFTPHDSAHLAHVEEHLDKMLFGGGPLDDRAFQPTPEEAAYLLSAVWLHDIGMLYGIFPGEAISADVNWGEVRGRHEERASRYIQELWQVNAWGHPHRVYLAQLCWYHRRKHPLGQMQPADVQGKAGQRVRLRELAGLLRLADACHFDRTRAPIGQKNTLLVLGMPVDSLCHWAMSEFVEGVAFDHSAMAVRPRFLLPPPKVFGTATVDFTGIVDRLVAGLREELNSVIPYTAAYSNICFREVREVINRPDALRPVRHMRDLWLHLLTQTRSASETASMLAAVVSAIVSGPATIPKNDVLAVLQHAVDKYGFNFLVRNLAREIVNRISKNEEPQPVNKFLNDYIEQREEVCHAVAARVNAALRLSREDTLIVKGLSHNVMTFLKDHCIGHRRPIIVLEHRGSGARGTNQTDDVMSELQKVGLPCIRLRAACLPVVLGKLRQEDGGHRVIVLASACGFRDNGDVYGDTGSAMTALVAQRYDLEFHIIAEEEKQLGADETVEIEKKLAELASEYLSGSSESAQAQQIDLLTAGMYSKILGLPEEPSARPLEAREDPSMLVQKSLPRPSLGAPNPST
jgi:hypothetical protein